MARSRATTSCGKPLPPHDFAARGVDIQPDEIFVSDGAKSDCGNIGDLFDVDNVVARVRPGLHRLCGHQRHEPAVPVSTTPRPGRWSNI